MRRCDEVGVTYYNCTVIKEFCDKELYNAFKKEFPHTHLRVVSEDRLDNTRYVLFLESMGCVELTGETTVQW